MTVLQLPVNRHTMPGATQYHYCTWKEIYDMAVDAAGEICVLFLHWTAGHYDQFFADYHLLVDRNGSMVRTTNDLTMYRAHTWRRNTAAIGIALTCAYQAQANSGFDTDFGPEPPTAQQLETTAQLIAVLCKTLQLPLTSMNVMTHQEIATLDGYGPYSGDPDTRWDLWYLPDSAENGAMRPGGYVLRGKALWYYQRYMLREEDWQRFKEEHGIHEERRLLAA